MPILARLVAAGAMLAACASTAPAQAPKPWKHGIIAPKADAGFFLMAAKRGFLEREGLKADLLEVKGSSGQGIRARVRNSQGERAVEGSDLLVAAGRVPNTQGLGLENTGVELVS